MDHHMPVMEGPEAIRMLRQTGYTRPIYSFTASDSSDDLDELRQAGSNGIVNKPVDRKKLYEVLGQHLKPVNNKPQAVSLDEEDEELKPIIEQFVLTLPERISQLKTYAAQDEWEEVRKIAHQIKGIGGSLGFPQLTEKGKLLDQAIKEARDQEYHSLLSSLLSDSQAVVDNYPHKAP